MLPNMAPKTGMTSSVANQVMGSGPPKKKGSHRGRKPSGKPGANHLGMLQTAHASGNYALAKTHALNYANAVHAATKPAMGGNGPGQQGEPDTDDVMEMAAPAPSMATTPSAQRSPMPPNRAMLAKLAMNRKK